MTWEGLPIVIFGSGGISREVFRILQDINHNNKFPVFDCLGFVENDPIEIGKEVFVGVKVVTCDSQFASYSVDKRVLGVVIPFGSPTIKSRVYNRIKNAENIVFPNIIHPSVQLDTDYTKLGVGNVFAAGAVLTCDVTLGNFNLINCNAIIGHDVTFGNFNVVNPLAAVSGNVRIGDCCLIGVGAKILQQLDISDGVTVGAGAVVVKSVESGKTVIGVPAKELHKG